MSQPSDLLPEAAVDPTLDALAEAVREVEQSVSVEGTPVGDWHGTLKQAPWFLIDRRGADDSVGYPGHLIGEFDDLQAAHTARARLVGLAAIRAASGGRSPYLP